jgi:predicted TIM-barrel fold metal-dependent hydrolase
MCIDVHHHFFLDAQKKAKKNLEAGWQTPHENLPWRPQTSLSAMDELGVQTAILSPPPMPSASCGEGNRLEVRQQNTYASKLCTTYPKRFGFFAGLPLLDDVEGSF